MQRKRYFSVRVGSRKGKPQTLSDLKQFFLSTYKKLERQDYFRELTGFYCTDINAPYIPGILGNDQETEVWRLTRNPGLWPIDRNIDDYSEEDLFTLIEFLYSTVSRPDEETVEVHGPDNECRHYNDYDREAGQQRFRDEINFDLADYERGYRLSENGEIEVVGEPGLSEILDAGLPSGTDQAIVNKVGNAMGFFRPYSSTIKERKAAVRELVAVLESLRPRLKQVLRSRDEQDLFNLANNFGIRHNNKAQKIDYDENIWTSWMFYYYLATIHASLRLMEKRDQLEKG